jgi:hypothetical protein
VRASGATLSVFCLGLLSAHTLYAEERIPFAGIDLIVDKVDQVEGGKIAVDIGGQRFLSPADEAGRHIAEAYAERPTLARRLPWATYGALVSQLAAGSDIGIARLAVTRVLESTELSVEEARTFFKILVVSASGGLILADQILRLSQNSPVQRATVCLALAFLPKSAMSAVHDRVKSDLMWAQDICPRELIREGQRALIDNHVKDSLASFEALVFLFQREDDTVRSARRSLESLRGIEEGLGSADARRFETALRVGAFDVNLADGIAKVQPALIQEFAQRTLVENKTTEAMRAISSLDFAQRNTSHHELLSKALRQITIGDAGVFEDPNVRKMMLSYATKDELVKKQALERLETLIREDAKLAGGRSGYGLLGAMEEIRPDPSRDNDELRVTIGAALMDNGDMLGAERILAQMRTPIPIGLRLKIFTRRSPYTAFGLATAASILVWSLLLIRLRAVSQNRTVARPAGEGKPNREETIGGASVGGHSLGRASYTDFDEYGEYLSRFNLKKGATLSDIKVAYRNAVKSCHPDLNPRATTADTEQFIELTKFYEKLIELHRERNKEEVDP